MLTAVDYLRTIYYTEEYNRYLTSKAKNNQ